MGRIVIVLLAWWAPPALAAQPLRIVSGPTVGPAADAPLARVLELETNVDSRVRVEAVAATDAWIRDFERYARHHLVPLLGFESGSTYSVRVTVFDRGGDHVEVDAGVVTTDPLPAVFPPLVTTISLPEAMEPGFTLFGVRHRGGDDPPFAVIVDHRGEVVWYRQMETAEIRQLPNGHLLHLDGVGVTESNLLGETLRHWHPAGSSEPPPPGSILVDSPTVHPVGFHHEAFPTGRGTILTSDRVFPIVEDYPTSETDPEAPPATVPVRDEPIVEFSMATGEVLGYWSLHGLLDPRRIGYDSVGEEGCAPDCPNDWGHVNAVVEDPGDPEDPGDDALVVSLRHQDATIKFSRLTGELLWVLGTHWNWTAEFLPYLLTPVGGALEWPYHQHAPELTPQGTLLLFDNGNHRASPFDGVPPTANVDNYSRAVEYRIDEREMTVEQVWEAGGTDGEDWFSVFLSDADRLPLTGNTLITFGGLTFVGHVPTDGLTARLVEVDTSLPPQTVFQLEITDPDPGEGYTVYRSDRIADLYPPPAEVLFADGFESGDTSQWDGSVP